MCKIVRYALAAFLFLALLSPAGAYNFGCKGIISNKKGDRYKVVVRYPVITDGKYTTETRREVNGLLKTLYASGVQTVRIPFTELSGVLR